MIRKFGRFVLILASISTLFSWGAAQAQANTSYINCAGVEDFINTLEDYCATIRGANYESQCSKQNKAFNDAFAAYRNAGCFGINARTEDCKRLGQTLNAAHANLQDCRENADLSENYQNCLEDAARLRKAHEQVCS